MARWGTLHQSVPKERELPKRISSTPTFKKYKKKSMMKSTSTKAKENSCVQKREREVLSTRFGSNLIAQSKV